MRTYSLNDIKGKVCVITGGAGVIGTSLAMGLASAGARIAIVDFNIEKAKETAAAGPGTETGAEVIGVFGNVLDRRRSLLDAKRNINETFGNDRCPYQRRGRERPDRYHAIRVHDERNDSAIFPKDSSVWIWKDSEKYST
jgi:NAD(P)-dependent dehydrogenase (short-subunit alcohol dehydrogenase family)